MTNGDKIRNMSNKELIGIVRCPYDRCNNSVEPIWNRSCNLCIEDWLNKNISKTNIEIIREMQSKELAEFLEYNNSYLPNGVSWSEWLEAETNFYKKPNFTNHTGNALDYPN